MSKRNRRPAVRPALSPREPARLTAGVYGTAGRAANAATADPTAGRHGGTCRHPRRNTNARAMAGGMSQRLLLRDVPPAPALEQPSAPTPARVGNRRLVKGKTELIRLAGESEGLRQPIAREHAVKRATGAVRAVPVPVWQSDLCPSCQWTPDTGRLVRRCAECRATDKCPACGEPAHVIGTEAAWRCTDALMLKAGINPETGRPVADEVADAAALILAAAGI